MIHSSMRAVVGIAVIAETGRAIVWIRRLLSTDAVCHWVILHKWCIPKDKKRIIEVVQDEKDNINNQATGVHQREEETMTRTHRCAVMFVCSIMAWGLSSLSHLVSAAGGDAAKGKSIYQAKCVTCHGPEGKGDGPIGKNLKPPAGDFSSAASKKKSADEFQDIIENGKPKTAMMAWNKQLSEAEIQDVLAYVLTLRN